MAAIETPSRILRRIQDQEQEEVPSLPSFPDFDTSGHPGNSTQHDDERERSLASFSSHLGDAESRITSTPLVPTDSRASLNAATTTFGRAQSSGGKSPAVNSTRSSLLSSEGTQERTYKLDDNRTSQQTITGPAAGVSIGRIEESDVLQDGSAVTERPQGQDESSEEQLNEAQESFVATEPVVEDEGFRSFDVSIRSAPKPSPQDPFRNVSIRRRSTQTVPRLSRTPSDSSTSSGGEPEAPAATPMRPSAQISASLSPPSHASPITRDASYMARAFSKTPLPPSRQNTPQASSEMTPVVRTPPITASDGPPSGGNPAFQTPMPAANSAASRRSYALAVLSTVSRPRVRGTPHPHAPMRGTPHPFGRGSLERPPFSPGSSSTPSTNNDLTTHPRANVSFDPATRDTRFNVVKMNTYLHQLNDKLATENLILHQSLMGAQSRSPGSNGVGSPAPSAMGTIMPDEVAPAEFSISATEQWQQVVSGLREELDEANADRHRLNEEIRVLNDNLQADQARASDSKQLQQELAKARAEAAEWKSSCEAKVAEFARDMAAAEHGVELLLSGWESKVADRDQEIQQLKKKIRDAEAHEASRVVSLQGRLEAEQAQRDTAASQQTEIIRDLHNRISDLEMNLKEHEDNEARVASTLATVDSLQHELQRVRGQLEHTQAALADERAALNRKEDELDEVRSSLSALSEELATAQDRIDELEAHSSARDDRDDRVDGDADRTWRSSLPDHSAAINAHEATRQRMEEELDEAHREIGKLKRQLLPSPSRAAISEAQNEHVRLLEAKVVALEEELQDLKALEHPRTPAKPTAADSSAIHKSVLALRTQLTPGSPLKDWSWLQQSFHNQSDAAPYLAEIARLQEIVESKERKVDDGLDELEVVLQRRNELISELEEERARKAEMELKLTRVTIRGANLEKRLKKMKCQNCRKKLDASYIVRSVDGGADESIDQIESSLDADPTVDIGAQYAVIAKLNDELASARSQANHDQRAQQDIQSVLEVQRTKARDEVRAIKDAEQRKRLLLQDELDRARSSMTALRRDLEAEKNKYQSLRDQEMRAQRDRDSIARQLEQKQKDLDDAKRRLQSVKRHKDELETRLEDDNRVNSDAQQQLAEANEEMDRLRQDRASLHAERSDLQQRLETLQEHLRDNRQALAQSAAKTERHRTELEEIASRHEEETRKLKDDNGRMAAERSDIKRTISGLEADLRYIRQEAETFGRDLIRLQNEKATLDARSQEDKQRYKAQTSTQIRLLNEQLVHAQDKVEELEAWIAEHVCTGGEQEVTDLKVRHKQESKGLALQIHYLKDLFRRESGFRSDLSYQKRHLLTLLACALKQPQQTILPLIARAASPHGAKRSRKTMKSVAWSLVFMSRVRAAGQKWREQRASRPLVHAALEDVRRKRVKTTAT